MMEARDHVSNLFITLTYKDSALPENEYIDPETGAYEQSPVHTLRRRDVQLFLKRLRKNSGQEIRYYGCGEYGDETFRPHYHLILFGLDLPASDLSFLRQSSAGFPYYRSELIEKCWPHGHSLVCNISWDTCCYVARYCTKNS